MSKIEGLRRALIEKNIDAALISDEFNCRYLSGFTYHDGAFLLTRTEAHLLTDFRYFEAACKNTAKNMYYTLSEAEKDLVVNAEVFLSVENTITNRYLVEKVQSMVNAYIKSGNQTDRLLALEAYNLLSDEAKAQITNSDKLLVEPQAKSNVGVIIVIIAGAIAVLAVVAVLIIKKRRAVK